MKKFMIAALAAGMLTACSDSAVVETPAGGGAQWGADGTGYVSLSINLPKTTSAGRANGNDKFEDGNANEWAVNDAILVLFTQGNTENEGQAKFQAAYQLPVNFNQSTPAADQITATAQITKRIQAIDGDNIKALVILNGISSGAFKCANGVAVDDKDNATLKYVDADGHDNAIAQNTPFSTFQAYTSNISTNAQKGLLMLNAPLTNAQSTAADNTFTGKKVSTLSEIIANNIKYTAAEAAAAPAANIYVERAVAKVTMSTTNTTGTVVNGGLPYVIQGIALDNTNPTSYLVRNADLIDATTDATMMSLRSASSTVQALTTGYRMVGNETVGIDKPGSSTNLYRTYFAKSTNYDGSADLKTVTATGSYTWTAPEDVAANPLFCMENTFPVDQMFFDNTTRAILQVKIGGGTGDRYILHNWDNAGNTWSTKAEMEAQVLANIQAMAVYQGKTISDVKLTDTGVENQNVLVLESYRVDGYLTNSGDDFNTAKNRIGDVYKYVNGIAYYEVRIQHFGDDLTPWNDGEYTTAPKEGGIDDIYPEPQDKNYLGRYGVLRNNWYNLTVNSVKRIGTPFIPKVKNVDTPDDVINSYISVNINILSWAKREQGVDLQ